MSLFDLGEEVAVVTSQTIVVDGGRLAGSSRAD